MGRIRQQPSPGHLAWLFEGWIDTKAACVMLGMTRQAMNQHVQAGHFTTAVAPCCGHLLYRREEIERYRDRNADKVMRLTPFCADDLTLKEVMSVLGIGYSAAWSRVQKGRLPMHQHGTRYAIHEREFADWLATQQLPRRQRNGVHA